MVKNSTTPKDNDKKPADQAILDARTIAANEISKDPDTMGDPASDDLDEGELARKDNSND